MVTVSFRTLLGLELTLPVGVVLGGEQWAPTLPLLVVGNLLSREARFKFSLRAGRRLADRRRLQVDPYSKG